MVLLDVWPFVCDIHKFTVLLTSHTFIAKQCEIIILKDVLEIQRTNLHEIILLIKWIVVTPLESKFFGENKKDSTLIILLI